MRTCTSPPINTDHADRSSDKSPLADLLRSIVTHTAATPPRESPIDDREEILLDAELDGMRYLLVRMPAAGRARVALSPREHEIVRMVAQGHPNKIIADVLNISSWTVGTHLRRIFAKLGVGSRAAMIARVGGVDHSSDHTSATHKMRLPR